MKVDKGTETLNRVKDRLRKMSPEEFKEIHDKATKQKREKALDELTEVSEELDLYEDDVSEPIVTDSYPVYRDPRLTRSPENRPPQTPPGNPNINIKLNFDFSGLGELFEHLYPEYAYDLPLNEQ